MTIFCTDIEFQNVIFDEKFNTCILINPVLRLSTHFKKFALYYSLSKKAFKAIETNIDCNL